MRLAPLVAGGLVVAAAAMAVVAFTAGNGDDAPEPGTATTVPAAARQGLDVWVQHGCGGCHALAAAGATGTLGPDLASSLQGKTRAEITADIVAPAATAAAGYDVGMMPEDYATRIPADDLERLVAFLHESTR